jgi:hypothetical protein
MAKWGTKNPPQKKRKIFGNNRNIFWETGKTS